MGYSRNWMVAPTPKFRTAPQGAVNPMTITPAKIRTASSRRVFAAMGGKTLYCRLSQEATAALDALVAKGMKKRAAVEAALIAAARRLT